MAANNLLDIVLGITISDQSETADMAQLIKDLNSIGDAYKLIVDNQDNIDDDFLDNLIKTLGSGGTGGTLGEGKNEDAKDAVRQDKVPEYFEPALSSLNKKINDIVTNMAISSNKRITKEIDDTKDKLSKDIKTDGDDTRQDVNEGEESTRKLSEFQYISLSRKIDDIWGVLGHLHQKAPSEGLMLLRAKAMAEDPDAWAKKYMPDDATFKRKGMREVFSSRLGIDKDATYDEGVDAFAEVVEYIGNTLEGYIDAGRIDEARGLYSAMSWMFKDASGRKQSARVQDINDLFDAIGFEKRQMFEQMGVFSPTLSAQKWGKDTEDSQIFLESQDWRQFHRDVMDEINTVKVDMDDDIKEKLDNSFMWSLRNLDSADVELALKDIIPDGDLSKIDPTQVKYPDISMRKEFTDYIIKQFDLVKAYGVEDKGKVTTPRFHDKGIGLSGDDLKEAIKAFEDDDSKVWFDSDKINNSSLKYLKDLEYGIDKEDTPALMDFIDNLYERVGADDATEWTKRKDYEMMALEFTKLKDRLDDMSDFYGYWRAKPYWTRKEMNKERTPDDNTSVYAGTRPGPSPTIPPKFKKNNPYIENTSPGIPNYPERITEYLDNSTEKLKDMKETMIEGITHIQEIVGGQGGDIAGTEETHKKLDAIKLLLDRALSGTAKRPDIDNALEKEKRSR